MSNTTLITAFNKIRSVPYKIIDIDYSLENSKSLIDSNGASCTPKHIVLDDLFRSHGYKTRFCVHEFRWSSMNLPKVLSSLIEPSQIDFHTNLEVVIDNQWIVLDATWDDALLNAGFPGTKYWDGKNSTANCVVSTKEYKFNTLKERNSFIQANSGNVYKEAEFIFQLNQYFEELRMKYT